MHFGYVSSVVCGGQSELGAGAERGSGKGTWGAWVVWGGTRRQLRGARGRGCVGLPGGEHPWSQVSGPKAGPRR